MKRWSILILGLFGGCVLIATFQNFSQPQPAFNASCTIWAPTQVHSSEPFDVIVECFNTGTEVWWNDQPFDDNCTTGYCISMTVNNGILLKGSTVEQPQAPIRAVAPGGPPLRITKHLQAPYWHTGDLHLQYRMFFPGLQHFGGTAPPFPAPYLEINFKEIGVVEDWKTVSTTMTTYYPHGSGCTCAAEDCGGRCDCDTRCTIDACNSGNCTCNMTACQNGLCPGRICVGNYCKAKCDANGICPGNGTTCTPMPMGQITDNLDPLTLSESLWDPFFATTQSPLAVAELCNGQGTNGMQPYIIFAADFNYGPRIASKFKRCDCVTFQCQ